MRGANIPFVRRDRDRHGNVRLYFQAGRRGKKVRILAEEGSPAFFAEYHRLRAQQPEKAALRGPVAGTWRWLCVEYFRSAEYGQLDAHTRGARRGVLEYTFDEPVAPGSEQTYGTVRVQHLTTKALCILRDRKATAGFPEAGNNRVKAIRAVFKWAMAAEPEGMGHLSTNPARDLTPVKTRSAGWHSWEVEEVRKFEARHPIGTKARLALDLMLYTGVRRSDAVLLGKQHARDGWLKFTTRKNANRRPMKVEIPILPALSATIAASPTGDLTYLVTNRGQPFTADGFGNWFRDRCVEAGVPGRAHGLRKAAAVIAAENGATSQQLMAIFGWGTLRQPEHYTRSAERRKMAGDAMPLLERKRR